MTHAFFKALLFLGAGSVIHALSGEQDLRQMGGLAKKVPITCAVLLCASLAIAGFPFTSGYFSKDLILESAFDYAPWMFWVGLFTAGMTAFYVFRAFFMAFFGEYRGKEHHPHESPFVMGDLSRSSPRSAWAVDSSTSRNIFQTLFLNIVEEMKALAEKYNTRIFRFVDDLFLASPPFMRKCLNTFKEFGIGDRFQWDATGRINILSKAPDSLLDLMRQTGCREVALGIESGSERLLRYMGKHITPDMTKTTVKALTSRGINVKGYFILGFPTETEADLEETVHLIHELWSIGESGPGTFRCSVFEFRPSAGTPEWNRLIATGRYHERGPVALQIRRLDRTRTSARDA